MTNISCKRKCKAPTRAEIKRHWKAFKSLGLTYDKPNASNLYKLKKSKVLTKAGYVKQKYVKMIGRVLSGLAGRGLPENLSNITYLRYIKGRITSSTEKVKKSPNWNWNKDDDDFPEEYYQEVKIDWNKLGKNAKTTTARLQFP